MYKTDYGGCPRERDPRMCSRINIMEICRKWPGALNRTDLAVVPNHTFAIGTMVEHRQSNPTLASAVEDETDTGAVFSPLFF
jgi:hypothetical protein